MSVTAAPRVTDDVRHQLDAAIAEFPAVIDMPVESGIPVVWAFNGHVTGTLILVAERSVVTTGRVTSGGNVEAAPLTEREDTLDDRWRIDLRTDAGFGFVLRVLARRPLVMAVSEFDVLTWKHLVGRVTSHERGVLIEALARSVPN